KALSNWEGGGGMQTWCFTPVELSGRVGSIARRHGLKPDWGELNVRNFRGGAGNVSEGRTRTPFHISKEWRVETLDLRLHAPVLYSTFIPPIWRRDFCTANVKLTMPVATRLGVGAATWPHASPTGS